MGDYARSATDRIAGILGEILKVSPQFVLLQEVTTAMYVEIKRILADWQVYRKRQQAEEYFNVTAVRLTTGPADRCTSFAFPSSHNGRHSLTVRRGDWVVTNIHAESGSRSVERDARSQ